MSSRFDKHDKYGQVIKPGDVCAAVVQNKVHLVVYKGDSWGGKHSKGEFGVFITPQGQSSLKYKGVVFAYDPMGERRSMAREIQSGVREYYEGKQE